MGLGCLALAVVGELRLHQNRLQLASRTSPIALGLKEVFAVSSLAATVVMELVVRTTHILVVEAD